jgi:hypothetical protein
VRRFTDMAALVAVITEGPDVPGGCRDTRHHAAVPSPSARVIPVSRSAAAPDSLLYVSDRAPGASRCSVPDWTVAFDGREAAAKPVAKALLQRAAATGQPTADPRRPRSQVWEAVPGGGGFVWVPGILIPR